MPSAEERREELKAVFHEASVCTRCPQLAATRQTVVFGSGNADADLMFVGEAPGANEDKQGIPFVGQAGQAARSAPGRDRAHARRTSSWSNVLKCRPPGNRDPLPQEIDNCQDYLFRQLDLIEPKVVCTLGNFSTKLLRADPSTGITKLHGREEIRVDRPARGPAVPDLPPGRRALHALAARHAARGLRPAARPCSRSTPPPQPEPEPEPEPIVEEPELVEEIEATQEEPSRRPSSDCSESVPSLRRARANGGW